MAESPRAIVLAAGYGTRLRPLTEHLPKPLLPVMGVPLVEIALRNLAAAGVREAAVNTHHLPEAIRRFLDGTLPDLPGAVPPPRVSRFHEPAILDTGGALWNARSFLGESERFLVHNGDVLCDVDLARLLHAHVASGATATLLLVDWPEVNTVRVDADGAVTGIGSGGEPAPEIGGEEGLTYSGIAVFERQVLDRLPEGASSLVTLLLELMRERPGSVRGFVPEDALWSDLGDLDRYLELHDELTEEAELELPGIVLHTSEGGGFLEAVEEEDWPEAVASFDTLAAERVAGAALRGELPLEPLVEQGSDREFLRGRCGETTCVLMRTRPEDPEFRRWLAVADFLTAEGFGGPEILRVQDVPPAVVMEDLGDDSLYGLASRIRPGDATRFRALYWNVLERLVDLQVRGTASLAAHPEHPAVDRLFDRAALRWETDYFRERFLGGVAGLDPSETEALTPGFEALADAALEQPVVLMHRDFQSRNLMFLVGEVRPIDFQGMRRGPLLYDPMSLLRDAYVDLGDAIRDELLVFYRDRLAASGGPDLDAPTFHRYSTVAGLQRVMQALGAFGFLGLVKGKRSFLDHVPLGLAHLDALLEAARAHDDLPLDPLREVVARVRGTHG